MKQYYIISGTLPEKEAIKIINFLNSISYIEADFSLMSVDDMEGL